MIVSQYSKPTIDYPDSDGMPKADNTLQWDKLVRIKEKPKPHLPERPERVRGGRSCCGTRSRGIIKRGLPRMPWSPLGVPRAGVGRTGSETVYPRRLFSRY